MYVVVVHPFFFFILCHEHVRGGCDLLNLSRAAVTVCDLFCGGQFSLGPGFVL